MHATNAGEKRKGLKKAAIALARDAKAARNAAESSPEAGEKALKLQEEADKLRAEAADLKDAARLEDLNLWVMEKWKRTKMGNKKYAYWMASWRECSRVRNVHLGSCNKLSREEALQKARKMKAEALGISRIA